VKFKPLSNSLNSCSHLDLLGSLQYTLMTCV